jgi:hypothetical protein
MPPIFIRGPSVNREGAERVRLPLMGEDSHRAIDMTGRPPCVVVDPENVRIRKLKGTLCERIPSLDDRLPELHE